MVTFYLFLLAVAAVGAVAYLFLFFSHVPGAEEERLGEWSPLPEPMNEWISTGERGESGFEKQLRYLPPEKGRMTKYIVQTRFRNPETGEIGDVLPEETVHRTRTRR